LYSERDCDCGARGCTWGDVQFSYRPICFIERGESEEPREGGRSRDVWALSRLLCCGAHTFLRRVVDLLRDVHALTKRPALQYERWISV